MSDDKLDNEQKYPIQTLIIRWASLAVSLCAVLFSVIVAVTAKNTVTEIKQYYQSQNQTQQQEVNNELENLQEQNQELINSLVIIQEQYQIIQNIINQEQSVDVIQARENDVLIRTPDEKWIIVPMIEKTDIEFSSEIIEKKYKKGESPLPRVDLFNNNNEDWSDRDGFTYSITYISINQNKMVSLNQFINSMSVEFKFFNNDKIEYVSDIFTFYEKDQKYDYLNVFEHVNTQKQYVTKEPIGFNGIEDIKISIIIEFEIAEKIFSIPYTFDEFIPVNEDF